MSVRTRMAPSPTGDYHIGHIRTVLFNYAFAKANNGQFIIRIEDTDKERQVDGALDRILDVIQAYGLNWDEGPRVGGAFSPYIQSERLALYQQHAKELVSLGKAYYCFCTPDRLDALRIEQQEQKLPVTKYDKKCEHISEKVVKENLAGGVPYVIRLKVPKDQMIAFHDEVLGDMSVNSNDIDDSVLLKSDGYPTYHLAVVVDDHLMGITHVMRGIDWLPSTPKHVLLYRAFGWEIPALIHLPNLKEKGENKKLSKRFGSVYAVSFLEEGYLPEALLNFCMLLGWNPGTEQEVISLDEFIKLFSINKLHKTDLVAFDREKLLWMNGYYLRSLSSEKLYDRLVAWSKGYNKDLGTGGFDSSYVHKVIPLIQDRLKLLSEFTSLTDFFFKNPEPDKATALKYAGDKAKLDLIISSFKKLYLDVSETDWQASFLDQASHKLLTDNGLKPKEAFMSLRVIVTGKEATPPLFDVLSVLGKKVVLERLGSFTS